MSERRRPGGDPPEGGPVRSLGIGSLPAYGFPVFAPEEPSLDPATEVEILIRDLLEVRDDLEARGAPAGLLFRAARWIAEHAPGEIDEENGRKASRCVGCGEPIEQARRGRPRRWCGQGACQRAAKAGSRRTPGLRKKPRNSPLAGR